MCVVGTKVMCKSAQNVAPDVAVFFVVFGNFLIVFLPPNIAVIDLSPAPPPRFHDNHPHMTEHFKVLRLWKIKTIVSAAAHLSACTTTFPQPVFRLQISDFCTTPRPAN